MTHAGTTYGVTLKRLATARRYTLRVRAALGRAILTMPQRGTLKHAEDFAQRHAAWIGSQMAQWPQPIPFKPGYSIPLRGEDCRIIHVPARISRIWRQGDHIYVAGDEDHIPRYVEAFLKSEARRDLAAAVARYAACLGLFPKRISLRDTISRWGSCSSSGALNFSWRLILAPPYVLDYVAAHEVVHWIHRNHSPAFWALTQQVCPQRDVAEAWLRREGASLHRFGKI